MPYSGLKAVEEVAKSMGVLPEEVMRLLDKGEMRYCDCCGYPTGVLDMIGDLCVECDAESDESFENVTLAVERDW